MVRRRLVELCFWLALLGAHISASPSLAAEKARDVFVELCSICHGAGGKGDGPSAAGLNPRPADFTNCQVMEAQPEEILFAIIKRGGQSVGRSTVMPAWGEALSDGQIRELVAVVRGFCQK
ncbi:MAG TPA: cytochrome c [Candidatus Methylomirabilis sp.]|jgi:mono/diheme cytochrome c family protein